MKEIIVLDFGAELKNICRGCAEGVKTKCPQTEEETKDCVLYTSRLDDYKVEQVPTNWEELKELCKSIKGNKKDLGGAMWFEFPIPKDSKLWLGKFLCIDEKGQIGIAEKTFGNDISITIFAENLKPERQYQIIKSLIG